MYSLSCVYVCVCTAITLVIFAPCSEVRTRRNLHLVIALWT